MIFPVRITTGTMWSTRNTNLREYDGLLNTSMLSNNKRYIRERMLVIQISGTDVIIWDNSWVRNLVILDYLNLLIERYRIRNNRVRVVGISPF